MLDKKDIVATEADYNKLFTKARRYERAMDTYIVQDPHGNILTINKNLMKFGMSPILDNGVHKKPKF